MSSWICDNPLGDTSAILIYMVGNEVHCLSHLCLRITNHNHAWLECSELVPLLVLISANVSTSRCYKGSS